MHKPTPGGFFPEQTFPQDKCAIVPETLLDSLIGDFKKTLYALLAAIFFLLLIACSNVANLLLARASAREREIAMRAAMGATRGRLIRQLLVESFVLALAACGIGCGLAYFGLKIVVALIPAGVLSDESVIRMNTPVLFLSLGVTILTTILCGLAPALHAVRSDLQPRLTGSSKGFGGSFRHGKFRAGLVVSEVALSIILLISAGLLMRSFLVLTRVDLGFDTKNVLYFELNLPPAYNTDVPGSLEKKNVTSARDVMVVNETFGRKYFPNGDPLGHKVKLQFLDSPFLDGPHDTYFEIVGIVRDYKTRGYESPSWQTFPEAYAPYSVSGYHWRTFMARTAVDPKPLLPNMGRKVA